MSDDDGEEVPILVCVPIRALPTPDEGSVRSVCQRCETPVWVSVHGWSFLTRNRKVYVACNNCAIEIIGEESFNTEGRVVPGSPRWMSRELKRLKDRKVNLADILRVKDLDE